MTQHCVTRTCSDRGWLTGGFKINLPLDICLGIYQNISRIDIHSTDSDQRALNSFHAGFLIVRLHDSSQHPSKSPSKLFVFIIELSGDVRIGGKMRSI